jgi:hypothetical protein
MDKKIIRMAIHPHLYKRFKVICAEKDLSMPKQNAELIRKFVEIQEDNNRKLPRGNNGNS